MGKFHTKNFIAMGSTRKDKKFMQGWDLGGWKGLAENHLGKADLGHLEGNKKAWRPKEKITIP